MLLPQPATNPTFSYRLRSLTRVFERKYDKIRLLGSKMSSIVPCDGMKPSLMRKMTAWISQLAKLHEKEAHILNEISDIEKKHEAMRQNKKLREAMPTCETELPPQPKPKRKSMWFELLLLWVLFSSNKKSPAPSPQ